ncbi:hypothetical protein [uncultured Chitinophaga sp.]|uniref:hypothetical protein n=1 Tax=uncultured Chitinophaga sp. TaxID=339340 RepID=UPI0025FE490C|nr:hypothetical protein [uncultured Chitinophaga sp.]
MHEFDQIFLSWRSGQGSSRHIVGQLSEVDGVFQFEYFPNEVEKALELGFAPYAEFPDVSQKYKTNVLEVFGQRLTKSERPDVKKFYDFWEVKPEFIHDKFYLLGHTQGLSPADNFEFLADYNPIKGLSFITELAGLSIRNLPADTLMVGDELRAELDAGNNFDQHAVRIFKAERFIGYIKQIHCRVFHKEGAQELKLRVKAIEKNGILKRVFIVVSI